MSCSTNTIGRSTPDVEHERAVAIFDLHRGKLLRAGRPCRRPLPPQALAGRIRSWSSPSAPRTAAPVATHILSLTPFRRIVKDYFMICESYYEAIRSVDAEPDRGDRHGPARHPQRRLADADGSARAARSSSISTRPGGSSRWSACSTGAGEAMATARDKPAEERKAAGRRSSSCAA